MTTPMRLLSRAARGAMAGLAVCATLFAALQYAMSTIARHPDADGPETLGATLLIWLAIAIPACLVVGLLTAWAVRLPRPWAVSLLGLFASTLLGCAAGSLQVRPPAQAGSSPPQ